MQKPTLITIVIMETKSKRTFQKVMKPRIPTFTVMILNEIQNDATVFGISSKETVITAKLAIAIVDRVPGSIALYCSANCKITNNLIISKFRIRN